MTLQRAIQHPGLAQDFEHVDDLPGAKNPPAEPVVGVARIMLLYLLYLLVDGLAAGVRR